MMVRLIVGDCLCSSLFEQDDAVCGRQSQAEHPPWHSSCRSGIAGCWFGRGSAVVRAEEAPQRRFCGRSWCGICRAALVPADVAVASVYLVLSAMLRYGDVSRGG